METTVQTQKISTAQTRPYEQRLGTAASNVVNRIQTVTRSIVQFVEAVTFLNNDLILSRIFYEKNQIK